MWCYWQEPTCQCRRHKRHGFNSWVGKMLWQRLWQPTPLFLPGESHGQRRVAGYNSQGHKELDMTESDLAHTHTPHYTLISRIYSSHITESFDQHPPIFSTWQLPFDSPSMSLIFFETHISLFSWSVQLDICWYFQRIILALLFFSIFVSFLFH